VEVLVWCRYFWLCPKIWLGCVVFAGRVWTPSRIVRVNGVKETSTRPLYVVTDEGPAIMKYMGNPQGLESLICELVGTELANNIGLVTPDFCVIEVPAIETYIYPFISTRAGPAFFSRWEGATALSPRSELLKKLRKPEDIAKLVAFDTWLRNADRLSGGDGAGTSNFDNLLLRPDKRKIQMLVIDHTHAIAETNLEDDLGPAWVEEECVYGLSDQFETFMTQRRLQAALAAIGAIDVQTVERICGSVPREWGMTAALTDRLARCITDRGARLQTWLPTALFDQHELNLVTGEGET
jgi:hypothetical protein